MNSNHNDYFFSFFKKIKENSEAAITLDCLMFLIISFYLTSITITSFSHILPTIHQKNRHNYRFSRKLYFQNCQKVNMAIPFLCQFTRTRIYVAARLCQPKNNLFESKCFVYRKTGNDSYNSYELAISEIRCSCFISTISLFTIDAICFTCCNLKNIAKFEDAGLFLIIKEKSTSWIFQFFV